MNITQTSEFSSSDGAANDNFGGGQPGLGIALALYNNIVIAGAPLHAVGANSQQGEAYVFDVTNPAAPVQKSMLIASDGVASDRFGYAVAVDRNIVVIGVPFFNSSTGKAYIFDITNPAVPVQKAVITAADGVGADTFGQSVAISGNLVIISAPDHGGAGNVYVYDITNPALPVLKSEFTSSDGVSGDEFGFNIDLQGTTAVVGAPLRNSSEGQVYVFDLSNPAAPVQKSEFVGSDSAGTDQLGYSVSLYNNIVVVSAIALGKVYVFDITNPSLPVQKSKLIPSDGINSAHSFTNFGNGVAIFGNFAVVGSTGSVASDHGKVYVFDVTNLSSPTQLAILTASDGAASDKFGWAVACQSPIFIASAPQHQVGANANQGAAYVFVGYASVPDCRNYGNFPNDSRLVQGTVTYDVPDVESRNPALFFEITSCANASGGNTAYTGTFVPTSFPTNSYANIVGFFVAPNNGSFKIVSCTATTLTVANPNGVAEGTFVAVDATVQVDSRAGGAPVDCRVASIIPQNSRVGLG